LNNMPETEIDKIQKGMMEYLEETENEQTYHIIRETALRTANEIFNKIIDKSDDLFRCECGQEFHAISIKDIKELQKAFEVD